MKTNQTANEQRLTALLAANKIRQARAADKTKLRNGKLSAARVLRTMPEHWESAKLYELLLPVPRVGRIKAQKTAEVYGANLHTRLGALNAGQRERLARSLERNGWA